MSEIRTLLFMELRSLWGVNQLLHTRDPKEKKRYITVLVAWLIIGVMIFFYVAALVWGLCSLGLGGIVPDYLVAISGLLILMFSVFTAGRQIFGTKGYDILASMPLRPRSIVVSRFLSMYVLDLIFTLSVMVPGAVAYAICLRPDVVFYITALVGTIFIPAIPLVISTLIGTLILAITSRFKKNSVMQNVVRVVFIVGVLVISYSLGSLSEKLSPDQFVDLAGMIEGGIARVYPPATWLGAAMVEGNFLYFGIFLLVSLAVMLLAVLVIAKGFHAIQHSLLAVSAKHNYKLEKLGSRSPLHALYVREAKRYFSSSVYMMNTIIGPVLSTIMAVALAIVGVDGIAAATALPVNLPGLLPFVSSAFFSMMTAAAVSVSMEGKQFWVIRSLPIPTKAWLDSKILFSLSLAAPFYLISTVAMAIAVGPHMADILWLVLIPLSIYVFVVVLGITVDLKFHNFDWAQEAVAVKQSLSSFLGGFAGFFVSVVAGIIVAFTPSSVAHMVRALICLLLWCGTTLLYRANNRKNLIDL